MIPLPTLLSCLKRTFGVPISTVLFMLMSTLCWGDATASVVTVKVTDPPFNATGDGVTDDTEAIQQAVDFVYANGGGTVIFPAGTYIVVSVGIHEGITYRGDGEAIIQRPENLTAQIGIDEAHWIRTFTTAKNGYEYSSDGEEDSAPLIISGLVFNGTNQTQGSYQDYELEHGALLFLHAAENSQSRLRAVVENCVFRNGVGDGVHFFTNVNAQLTNCRADNCFRGGMTITGGNTIIMADSFTTTGEIDSTGIDIEVDSPGFNGSFIVNIFMNNFRLDSDFEIGVQPGSRVEAHHITTLAPTFNLYSPGSDIRITDSKFRYSNDVGGNGDGGRILNPGITTFTRCTFIAVDDQIAEPHLISAAPHIYWNNCCTNETDQRVRFKDCHFQAEDGLAETHQLTAIATGVTSIANNNRITIVGGSISSDFDFGVKTDRGGEFHIERVDIRAEIPFYGLGFFTSAGSQDYVDLTFKDFVFMSPSSFFMYGYDSVAGNILRHDSVIVPEAANRITTRHGIEGVEVTGSRTILGNVAPTAATHGLVGDRYLIGGAFVWVCTVSGYDRTTDPCHAPASVLSSKDSSWLLMVPSIPAPDRLWATSGTLKGQVRLVWNPVSGAGQYEVLRGTRRDSATMTVVGFANQASYLDTTTQSGVRYYYQVRVVKPEIGELSHFVKGYAMAYGQAK